MFFDFLWHGGGFPKLMGALCGRVCCVGLAYA